MDGSGASLKRLVALWERLGHLQPSTPEYTTLVKQIRAESDAYNARIEAQESPHRKPKDSSRR
jgi:hypothetical protein